MKKFMLFVSLLFLVLTTGCSQKESGISTAKTNKEFIVEYSNYTVHESHEIFLAGGTVIDVVIVNVDGELNVNVSNHESVYQGINPISSKFSITIPEDDRYTFSVRGDKATGRISFIIR